MKIKSRPVSAIKAPLRTSPYLSKRPKLTLCNPEAPSKHITTYVVIVDAAKTTAMIASCPGPYLAAAKNAGIPSTIGDEPMIRSNAVRDDVLCV